MVKLRLNQDDLVVVKKLANLDEDTDSRDWPEVKFYTQKSNEPRRWAEICERAFKLAKDPVVQIWLLIEQTYGLRRQPGRWDMDEVVGLLDEARRRIELLDRGHLRRSRLLEICSYHSGLVFRLAGNHVKSAQAHETAAALARAQGNVAYQRLELHQASHEKLNDAIVSKADNVALMAAYDEFKRNAQTALRYFPAGPNIDQQRANIFYHQCLYRWIIERAGPVKEKLDYVKKAAEVMPGGFVYCREIVLAIKHFPNYADTDGFLEHFENVALFFKVLAYLLSVRSLESLDYEDDARRRLDDAKALLEEGHGGELAFALMGMHNELE